MKNRAIINELLWSFLLTIPVIIYYIAHYHPPQGLLGTGFVAGDMASYMANARQHFDEGQFHFLYANPFNLDASGPHIYFQFQTFLLGTIWYMTGMDVGSVFMIFGFVFTFLAIWMALKIIKELIGWGSPAAILTFLLFVYGGGILVLSGFVYNYYQGMDFLHSALKSLIFDPGGGFWMLSLGKNFVYPTEAYYHFITLAIVLAVIKRKYNLISVLLFILAFSHPFYGIQFLLITIGWQFCEIMILKNHEYKWKHLLINIGTLLLFIAYNFLFLNSFPEHRIIVKQWSLNWILPGISFVLAYGSLFIILFIRILKPFERKKLLNDPVQLFLLTYLLVSIVLANHELFINPVQPIHFAHGHIYIPLFLLAMPVLFQLFRRQGSIILQLSKIAVFLLLIFDNLSWFPAQYYNSMYSEKGARLKVTNEQMEVVHYLRDHYNFEFILNSDDSKIEYLATTYTGVYGLIPHGHNTPFVKDRKKLHYQFFTKNNFNILPNKNLLVVDDLRNGMLQALKTNPNFVEVYRTKQYILYERKQIAK